MWGTGGLRHGVFGAEGNTGEHKTVITRKTKRLVYHTLEGGNQTGKWRISSSQRRAVIKSKPRKRKKGKFSSREGHIEWNTTGGKRRTMGFSPGAGGSGSTDSRGFQANVVIHANKGNDNAKKPQRAHFSSSHRKRSLAKIGQRGPAYWALGGRGGKTEPSIMKEC